MVRDDPETAAVLQPLRNLCEYRRDSILRDSLDKSALENATVTNNDYLGRIAKHYFTITHINTMLAVYSSRGMRFLTLLQFTTEHEEKTLRVLSAG